MEQTTVEMRLPPASLLSRVRSKISRLFWGAVWRSRLREFGEGSSIAQPANLLGGKSIVIGKRVTIWSGARIEAFLREDGGPSLTIGERTIIQPGVHIGAALSVTIGKGVLMASGVYITDHDHDNTDPFEVGRTHHRLLASPTVIGDDVWLGERVIVLKGVTIGEHSVIGAGSVVTRSIPPLCVAAGSPARVIKRFDPQSKAWLPEVRR